MIYMKVVNHISLSSEETEDWHLALPPSQSMEKKLSSSWGGGTHVDHQKSKRVPEKNIYFCFTDYAKAFNCVDHNKLWKILKDMQIAEHLTCLLRNLYAGQEATELDMEQHTGSK